MGEVSAPDKVATCSFGSHSNYHPASSKRVNGNIEMVALNCMVKNFTGPGTTVRDRLCLNAGTSSSKGERCNVHFGSHPATLNI